MKRLDKGILISVIVFLFAVSPWAVAFGQDIKIGASKMAPPQSPAHL